MDGQPTGTVTFLFTDVEGSTRRWEDHPADALAAALQAQRALQAMTLEQATAATLGETEPY